MIEYDGCPFCHEISGDPTRSFYFNHIFPSTMVADRKVFETKHFILIPAIGSFVEGYLLAVSKKHTYSLMDSTEQVRDELIEIDKVITEYYQYQYNSDCLYFEHGATSNDNGGTSVVHTHIHFVPFDKKCSLPSLAFPGAVQSKALSDISQSYEVNSTYLLVKSPDGMISYFNVGPFPSQILRRLVAEALGCASKWDWKTNYCESNMMKTLESAKIFFQEKYHAW